MLNLSTYRPQFHDPPFKLFEEDRPSAIRGERQISTVKKLIIELNELLCLWQVIIRLIRLIRW